MKKRLPFLLSGIPLLILLPFFVTAMLNGPDTVLLKRSPGPEEILPVIVSMQISPDYEPAAVEAQAVIARSNLRRRLNEKDTMPGILAELGEELEQAPGFLKIPDSVYENAVSSTEGQVLLYDGELKLVPFHELSGGVTRDGETALHDSAFAYLKSVDSSADKNSPDYLSSTYIAQRQLPESLNINEREDSGYVVSLAADSSLMDGEAFARGMGLASSDFSMQKVGDEIRFLCRGKGHGLGFSQYGGNELAKDGKTWQEILAAYFPEMEIGEYQA